MTWLWASAALMIVTAVVHSLVGERRLIGPLMRESVGPLRSSLGRAVIRYAWHVTSVLMIACAATVVWARTPASLVRVIGMAWLLLGVVSLIWTRGRHIGWPVLGAAGICAILGVA